MSRRHDCPICRARTCGQCGEAFTVENPLAFYALDVPLCATCARVPVPALTEAR